MSNREPRDRARDISLDITIAISKFKGQVDQELTAGALVAKHLTFGDVEVGQITRQRTPRLFGAKLLAWYLSVANNGQTTQLWLPNDESDPASPLIAMTKEPTLQEGWNKIQVGISDHIEEPRGLLDKADGLLAGISLNGIHRTVGGTFLIRSLMFP